jgi:phosphonate transport system ATP-binding protein
MVALAGSKGNQPKERHTVVPAVEISSLTKTFDQTKALDGVRIQVNPGEMVALIGPSGSGKSTLLKHLSGLVISDEDEGSVKVMGRTVQRSGDLTTRIRSIRAQIGFIFQQFNLVGRLPLITNVLTGMLARVPIWRSLLRWFTYSEKKLAMEALARVGMTEYATQRASTLSGGQQQRAAIARAMVQGAQIILADEPIASLDPESARKVMRTLSRINREDEVTVLVSLHQVDFAMQFCSRCIGLREGKVFFDGPTEELSTELLRDLYGAEFSDVEEGIDIIAQIAAGRPKKEEEEAEFRLLRGAAEA